MTFRDLKIKLEELTDGQLDCRLTVEDGTMEECWPCEFRICNDTHHSLDDNHPVIYFT